ncbi:MAG TPA: glycosyltransferase family 87 protein [Solirubrobacteraceae bacterium]|nr:glycosyltransferase family 87 protein [Solirubrobacteraceae bacterium]
MSYTSVALKPSVTARTPARWLARLRAHLALTVATLTLVGATAGLLLTHTQTRLAVPRAAAIHAVLDNSALQKTLGGLGWNRVAVAPMDGRYEEVDFYRGGRMVEEVTLARTSRGLVLDATDLATQRYAYGSDIANDGRVLAGLAILFVLMTAVWPLWRLRNLDCLVAAGTALSVVFLNRWTLDRMVLASYPAMIYLALRCLCQGLAPPGCRLPVTPLYDHLTRGWPAEQRVRVLRVGVVALALITAMVGFTSLHVLDVGYAVMEGATDVVHGVLPYGHIPDILHGDTYPIGSYLFYAPFAVFWPVHTAWDDADVTLVLAVLGALLVAFSAWRLTPRSPTSTTGLRMAIAVLAFPPLLVTVSTGTTDVVLAAMLGLVLVLWRRPGWGGAVLSGAAWFKASPILLAPLVLARLRGSGVRRALIAMIGVSVLMVGLLVALGGTAAPERMLSAMAFQFTRASPHTLWAMVGSVPLQQVAEALTLAVIAGAAVRLRRDDRLAEDRSRVAALAAAILLGAQISASYWNYMYLVWALPFLVPALLTS